MSELLTRVFGPWVRGVDLPTLRADGIAGVLGALLVLPQAIAFASLAGLPSEYGLYTAIVPCAVAALFGSSWHVVSGPTNATSLALFATLAPLALVGSTAYVGLALAVTVMVGVMQWLIGALRLGSIANFISPSALHGFTSGAAALIALHALPDLLGLTGTAPHGSGALLVHLAAHLNALNPAALLVGAITLTAVLLARRWLPRWPHLLLGLGAGTLTAVLLGGAPAQTGVLPWGVAGPVALLGAIPAIWPRFSWPRVDLASLPELLSIAFALTIVALGQSISIAKTIAVRSGQAIDANREFRGQGLANIVGGFFSSYVACGSLNRSLPNLEAGARTPLAAVFAAGWLLLLVAFTRPVLALIPLPTIAALLLAVAWSLFDAPGWRRLWAYSRPDFAIAAVTAAATLSIRLEMAILLGTILSLVAYLHRTSRPSMRVMGFDVGSNGRAAEGITSERPFVVRADVAAPLPECPQLKMIRMEGEVYFGAVPYVADQLRGLRVDDVAPPRHLLVMAKSMNFIDLPAAELWRGELAARRALGGDLYFHRPRPPVVELWQRLGFIRELGADHVFATKRSAISTIFGRLDAGICARCSARIYDECQSLPPPLPPPSSPPSQPPLR